METVCLANDIGAVISQWLHPDAGVVAQVSSSRLAISPFERQLVTDAVPQRQAEFATGRWCAHRALERIGVPTDVILRDRHGGPIWPAGVHGTIAHESGVCVAAVARAALVRHLGIDLVDTRREVDFAKIGDLFITPEDEISGTEEGARLAFCVKEAVVKAVSARLNRFLDMREIKISLQENRFQASLSAIPEKLFGHWSYVGPFAVACTAE